MSGRIEVPVRPGVSFVHDPSWGTGKTSDMAKGLFLCCAGRLCAGSSAGFGLPVMKMRRRTCFPSLASVAFQGTEGVVKEFTLDRTLAWTIHGKRTPSWFGPALEVLVEVFMGLPRLQQPLLRARALAFGLFALRSSMVRSSSHGRCSVTYVPAGDGLKITVQWGAPHVDGSLFIMNEVDGRTFNRIRTGRVVLEDRMIPAWFSVPFEAVLESQEIGVGVSIKPRTKVDDLHSGLFCGREVSADLDWAGLAVPCRSPSFSYHVSVREGIRG